MYEAKGGRSAKANPRAFHIKAESGDILLVCGGRFSLGVINARSKRVWGVGLWYVCSFPFQILIEVTKFSLLVRLGKNTIQNDMLFIIKRDYRGCHADSLVSMW